MASSGSGFGAARGAGGRVRSLQHSHDTLQRDKNGILVRTDPIRDCAGNPVPDGTIVTFTSTDRQGKSTVDARIKRGIAAGELPASNDATISVASGVVMGNEIQWGGGQMKSVLRVLPRAGGRCRCHALVCSDSMRFCARGQRSGDCH